MSIINKLKILILASVMVSIAPPVKAQPDSTTLIVTGTVHSARINFNEKILPGILQKIKHIAPSGEFEYLKEKPKLESSIKRDKAFSSLDPFTFGRTDPHADLDDQGFAIPQLFDPCPAKT
jgi:hypothetical protein